VTLIPEMAVPFETRSAPVSVAHLPQPRPQRTIGVVWRKTNPLAAQFRHLAEILRETALREMPE
jgi:LysR family hydrogen peroxide-inducible transcriptional activator